MIRINHSSNWYPDFVSDSILDIDLKALTRIGITHIVFDLDKTLVSHGSNTISREYLDWLRVIQGAGFTIMIGSNTRRDIRSLSAVLNIAFTVPSGISYKPFPSFYRRIVAKSDTSPKHIAMVGDHILNDTIGANHAGLTTILVAGLRGKASLINRTYLKLIFIGHQNHQNR